MAGSIANYYCFSDILSKEQKQREFDNNSSRDSALSRGACCGLILLLFALACLPIITTLWFISSYYFLHPPIANVTDSTISKLEPQYLSLAQPSQLTTTGVFILFVVMLFFVLCCNNNSFSTTFRLIIYPFFTKIPIKECDTNLKFEVDSKKKKWKLIRGRQAFELKGRVSGSRGSNNLPKEIFI